MNIPLSEESRRFLADQVAAGRYPSEEAVLEEALSRMRLQEQPASHPEPTPGDRQPIWETIAEIARRAPDDQWDAIPTDASYQLDHYLYGAPKKPTP